jgi:hypothetical protein
MTALLKPRVRLLISCAKRGTLSPLIRDYNWSPVAFHIPARPAHTFAHPSTRFFSSFESIVTLCLIAYIAIKKVVTYTLLYKCLTLLSMEFNSQGCDILSPPPDWLSQLPQASALLQGYSSFKTVIEDGMSVPGCGNAQSG